MAFSHLGLATGDLEATHRFYTDAMGFPLVHVEAASTETPGGWLRHALYDTGDGTLLAFQELHDERCEGVDFAISRGLGLPPWVNHLAFRADTLSDLDAARDRWLGFGCDVVGMRHTHGSSVYTEDPNGNVVEWAYTERPFTESEQRDAMSRLRDPDLPRDAPTDLEFFLAADFAARNA
jgi:catechol 2,3-dioxygenase-like lactoylglutathione lyase family enzyme